jgi:anti-sigma factor RsiW
MENRVRCAESLRVQAYFDAEVDAVSATDIEHHLEHCSECHTLLHDLEQVRIVLRQDSDYVRASPALRAKIMLALDDEAPAEIPAAEGRFAPRLTPPVQGLRPRRERVAPNWRTRSFWMGAVGGVGGTAIAATFGFLLLVPQLPNPLLDELVSAHVRSLMPSHLIDVVSTDKHTVKPWFAGHADVSPVVADFEPEGYRLIGGRVDYLDHQRSAVVVYQHGAHVINVFSWAGHESVSPSELTRSGYHLVFWKVGDLEYCAVSDTGRDELLGLVRLLRE